MKKIISFVLPLFFGVFLMECSRGGETVGYGYYVWVNDSAYQITLTGAPDLLVDEVLQPRGHLEIEGSGGFGSPSSPAALFTANITVVFGDGTYRVTYGRPSLLDEYRVPGVNYDPPYNPAWDDNYVQEDVARPNGCKKCPGRRWTYTFTNADYDAAVAYTQAQEE